MNGSENVTVSATKQMSKLKYFTMLVIGVALGALGEEFMDYVNHVILHGVYP